LFQSRNPGVELQYTIPLQNITEKRSPKFHWKYTDWTHCTSSCGGGFVVYCVRYSLLLHFMIRC